MCKVVITLYRHWENKRVRFNSRVAANINFRRMQQFFLTMHRNNTCSLEATASVDEIMKFMRSQKKDWNVTIQKNIDPLPSQIGTAGKFCPFRVRIFVASWKLLRSHSRSHV